MLPLGIDPPGSQAVMDDNYRYVHGIYSRRAFIEYSRRAFIEHVRGITLTLLRLHY